MQQLTVKKFKFQLLIVLGMILLVPTVSPAQDRGEILEGLLKSLIESKLKKNRPPRVPRPGGQPVPPVNSQEIREARAQLRAFSSESSKLVAALRREERSTPQVRGLLADAMRLNADASVLQQRAEQSYRFNDIREDYRQLDQSWRVLSHRIRQAPDIGRPCITAVSRVSAIDTKLCSLFDIEPQLNRTELTRLGALFVASFRRLQDDVRFDLLRHPQRDVLVRDGHALSLKINQTDALFRYGVHADIVRAFQSCQRDWQTYTARLRTTRSERIHRDIIEIEEIGRSIAELLWLDNTVNKGYLLQLSRSIETETDQLLNHITLDRMFALRDPARLVTTAREFDTACHEFTHTIEQTDDIDQLAWDFRSYEVQWREFSREVRGIETPEMQQMRSALERNISLLKQSLHLQPEFDHRAVEQMAASLDDLCSQLEILGQRHIVKNGAYPQQFRIHFAEEIEHLHDDAHHLHDDLSEYADEHHVQKLAMSLIRHWNDIKSDISQCRQQEKQVLYPVISRIEPLMLNLQVVFGE